ncbi:MFS transporter [Chloroflexota bacterium]
MAKNLMGGNQTVETEESRTYRLRWWTLLVLALSTLVVSLNASVLNVALPTIQSELGATVTQIQWIANIYMMMVGALLLTFGALTDKLGRAKILQGGLVVFCLANFGAAFSTDATHLIIARAFMGVSVAMMQSCVLAIIVCTFPGEERGKAIGVWAGIVGSGIALGSITGGIILQTLSWEWIFVFNFCMGAIALVLGWFLVPDSRDARPQRLDVFGSILFFAGIASLIYGLNNAGSNGWTDPIVLGTILSSLGVLIIFVRWEQQRPNPILDMSFFRSASFTTSLAAISILLFSFVGIHYLLTFYMQFAKGYTPLETGVRYIPLAAGGLIGSMLSDRLVTRLGMKLVTSLGFIGGALVFLSMAFLKITTPFNQLGPELFLLGFLNGSANAPIRTMLMRSLPTAKAGIGSAVNNIATYVMGSISVAALGSILSTIYSDRFMKAATSFEGISDDLLDKASDSIGGAIKITESGHIPPDMVDPFTSAARHSFMDGWQIVAIVLCGICVVGTVICLWIMPGRPDESKGTTNQKTISGDETEP